MMGRWCSSKLFPIIFLYIDKLYKLICVIFVRFKCKITLMTLIAAWIGVDCKKDGDKVSSIYFAADSRFSWGNTQSSPKYDEGIKVFCSLKHPYIFAYCGDVLFPLHTLERIIYKIDCDLFFELADDNFSKKLLSIKTEFESSIMIYPHPKPSFSILFASREAYYDFHLGEITSCNGDISHSEIKLPNKSGIVYTGGSGKNYFNKVVSEQLHNPSEGTSRFCFHCIAKSIKNNNSPTVGGAPQLVGLYRKGNGIIFGIEYNGERYILGKRTDFITEHLHIEWRNSNFERINPQTLKLQKGAQAQPFK